MTPAQCPAAAGHLSWNWSTDYHLQQSWNMSSVFFQDQVLVISAVILKRFQCSLTISPKWPAIFTIWTEKVFKSHLNMNLNKQRITSICVGGGKSKLIFAMCAKRSAGLAAECVAAWQISRLG